MEGRNIILQLRIIFIPNSSLAVYSPYNRMDFIQGYHTAVKFNYLSSHNITWKMPPDSKGRKTDSTSGNI